MKMISRRRLEKLEKNRTLTQSCETMPEGLTPMQQYFYLINLPLSPRIGKTEKGTIKSMSPEEAYAVMTGRM